MATQPKDVCAFLPPSPRFWGADDDKSGEVPAIEPSVGAQQARSVFRSMGSHEEISNQMLSKADRGGARGTGQDYRRATPVALW